MPPKSDAKRKRAEESGKEEDDNIIEITDLPDATLTADQKAWLIKEYLEKFQEAKDMRGVVKGQNGKSYAHKVVTPLYVAHWHPTLSAEAQQRMVKHSVDVSTTSNFARTLLLIPSHNSFLYCH